MELTRHDIPDSVKNLLKIATETGVYDLSDLYCSAIQHGTDWKALTAEICETGFARRMSDTEIHSRIVKAAEAVWMEF